ncbi:MAG TPA: hypothetical protein VFA09_21105 [Ktedonobacteraceae bacterium]|nr:hypothetical protein [Ktedonobacteraceae bacterium]
MHEQKQHKVAGHTTTSYFVLLLLALLVSSCSLGGGPPMSIATPTPTQVPGSNLPAPTVVDLPDILETEQLLLMTPHPVRDLYSLAQRLKLHTSSPIPHVGRTKPLNAHPGQEDSFWLHNSDSDTYSRIRAKLVNITPHVYMYVEDGQQVNLAALASSATIFEKQIYPTERANFGSEWSPGIDDDVHLTILNAAGLGTNTGGYFSEIDEYPTSVNPYSNEREMFYVNLDSTIPGSADYNGTLAHEFQLMIHWHLHPSDPGWVNEGMSVLAQQINGYPAEGVDLAFVQSPDTQLNDWSNDINAALPHYGAGYLFMDYFAEHYGGYSVLKELLQDPATPPTNFDDVLAKHGYTDRFMDVFNKWLIANYVEDPNVDQGEYGYLSIDLPGVNPQHSITHYPGTETDAVHQYAAEYYDFQPQGRRGTLAISLKGTPTVRVIGNDPLGSPAEWWSNSYDTMDSTLTRSFDLTSLKGKHVALQFATWFDLEKDHDYAFVEVSTDGTNWTTLKGNYTTNSNPNGLNWGNGYTAASGGSTPSWVQESVDLTPYSGKNIQVRFETVTDDAVSLQGFAIDQIRIPQLNFQDAVDSDNGWVSKGFIRSNNVLPEHYDVQALIYSGSTFRVVPMPVDLASGQGKLIIPGFGTQATRVVLIVSANAPETTLLAHYQVSATIG